MNLTILVAFFASVCVGCGVLFANSQRSINRAFFLLSINVDAWLLSLDWLRDPANSDPVAWLRITAALAAPIPFFLAVVKDMVKGGAFGWQSIYGRRAWLITSILLILLCFTKYYIPADSTPLHPRVGIGWTLYSVGVTTSYLVLLILAIIDLRSCSGVQKIEMQILLFGGAAVGLISTMLAFLASILGNHGLMRNAAPTTLILFYGITAWGITARKVFDARHLFLSGFRKAMSVAVVACIVGLSFFIGADVVPRAVVAIMCGVLITLIFNRFNTGVWRATQLGGDREAEAIRTAILVAGRDEFNHDTLVRRFNGILCRWGRTERAHFLDSVKDTYTTGHLSLPSTTQAAAEILRVKWATPESLLRQREASGRRELLEFMRNNRLGAMVCGPSDDGPAPFIIALENRRDRTPFTWTEISLLQDWVIVIGNLLSRISLTQQARESEQLRTAGLLGASLAHEIRNPLVTLKTIAQSAKTRFNDPEFRRLLIELVPTEIERIEGLVSGLMDLGRPQHPHFENVSLNEIVETSIKLVRPKALDEAVVLSCAMDANPDEVNADRSSIRQVILNLVMNAIQAVAVIEGKREVAVRTSGGRGSVVLEVADNGPGMPFEVRERLFQPFTTSNKTSGIGLGLAISADLVKLHHGQIALVDVGEVGTTFRVTLPCQQPTS